MQDAVQQHEKLSRRAALARKYPAGRGWEATEWLEKSTLAGRVVEIARSYVGTKWVHAGRTRQGIDCAGLVILSVQEAGYALTDVQNYSMQDEFALLLDSIDRHFIFLPEYCTVELGDVIVFRGPKMYNHVGIYSNYNRFLHAYQSVDSVIESDLSLGWRSMIHGVYRLRETWEQ